LKIAFDEHVPPAISKVFLALAKERAIRRTTKKLILEVAKDYAPKKTDDDYIKGSDAPWLTRFAKAGGYGVISGDTKMRRVPHERLALYRYNFIVIFFESQWSGWNFYHKSALLLHWWPVIAKKFETAPRGTFWVVPCNYSRDNLELRNVSIGLAQLLKDNPDRSPRSPKRKTRRPTAKKIDGDLLPGFES
jgi:hypothetical protein